MSLLSPPVHAGMRASRSARSSPLRLAAAARVASSTASHAPPTASLPTASPSRRPEPLQRTALGPGVGLRGARPPGPRPYAPRLAADAPGDAAVAIFRDVVNKGPPVASGAPGATLSEWDLAARLKRLSYGLAVAPDKLASFEADVWPHIEAYRGQVPKHLWIATMDFMTNVGTAAAADGLTGISLRLSRMCARVGKWELGLRNQLVLGLCHRLLTDGPGAVAGPGIGPVLQELIDLWKHISQLRRRSQPYNARPQFVLPTAAEILTVVEAEHQGSAHVPAATKALSTIFIQYLPEEAHALVPGLLSTLAVLADTHLASPDATAAAAPLLGLVAAALQRAMPDDAYVRAVFDMPMRRFPGDKLADLRTHVLVQWPLVSALLLDPAASWRQRPGIARRFAAAGLGSFHQQLRFAFRSRNVGAAVSVWEDLRARMAQCPHLVRQVRDEPEFLDFCIFVWCAVRKPARLAETLRLMGDLGLQPTIKSYTAMMHGWKKCKDTVRMATLWNELVESGVQLDAHIWTERISGLVEAGKLQAALLALSEMMTQWKQAVGKSGLEGAAATAVQPTIENVNAAFKGIIRVDVKAAHEVLAWAGHHGIEPNVRTYNVLIRHAFRDGRPDDVQVHLRAMRSRGIDPDAATFTIILEEVIGTMLHAPAAEQVEGVRQVLADIEASGLRPNAETYAKMLHAVSSLGSGGADEAVAAIQRHMRGAGLAVTPHIVAILIDRALARKPPARGAVHAILREYGLASVDQGDQTLWERVTSAHASVGDTDAAMAVFADLARAGRPIASLSCLTDLVNALLEAERRADARDVVRATLVHKTANRPDDNRCWRHHFWHLAHVEGLLDLAAAPPGLRDQLRDAT